MNWKAGFLVTIWFLVGVIIFAITKDWQIVAAIATWLLAGGIVFAIVQVQQMRRSTNAQLAVELFRELRDKDLLNTFRKIYQLRPADIERLLTNTNKKDEELRHEIEGVLDKFEMLGGLVNRRIIDESLAIEVFAGPPALRCWYQIVKYIKEEQGRRGCYCENYEDFARCSLEYFKNANKRIMFYREGEEDIKDLVTELQKKELRPRSLEEIKRARKMTR